MHLRLADDELHSLSAGIEAQRLSVADLEWDPPPLLMAPASGGVLAQWAADLPERASWSPEGRDADLVARDGLLLGAVLSGWKILRLVEGFTHAWRSGAQGFDGMTAAVVVRAAMEEAARLSIAGRRLEAEVEAWLASADSSATDPVLSPQLVDFAAGLLDIEETTGLEVESNTRWRALDSVKSAAPEGSFYGGGEDGAEYLYGRLSTYVHPKGVSRSLFRNTGFVGAEGLVREPSKNQSSRLMWECVAAYVYVADAFDAGLKSFTSAVSAIDGRSPSLRDRGVALLCFTDQTLLATTSAAQDGTGTTARRDGVWTYLEAGNSAGV